MKRVIFLATLVFVTMSAAACTREKPPVTEPTTTVVASALTPQTIPTGGVASPTLSGSTEPTPFAVETPSVIATLPGETLPAVAATATPPSNIATEAAPSGPGSGAPTGSSTTYTVQWGDWLNKIAARFGVSTAAILAANPGLDPNRIRPGQVINIPAAGASIPTITPGAVSPPSSGSTTYTVQRGDWFYSIARKFGVTVSALQAANPGVNPNFVYPGQVLNIPGSRTDATPTAGESATSYKVKPGDTLYSIAVRFGKTVYALQIANNLPNPNSIYPGQTLTIP